VDALREADAEVTYLKNEGFPPLQIKGKTLNGGEMSVDGSVSSQLELLSIGYQSRARCHWFLICPRQYCHNR